MAKLFNFKNCANNREGSNCERCKPGYVFDSFGNCRIDVSIRFNVQDVELRPNINFTIIVLISAVNR